MFLLVRQSEGWLWVKGQRSDGQLFLNSNPPLDQPHYLWVLSMSSLTELRYDLRHASMIAFSSKALWGIIYRAVGKEVETIAKKEQAIRGFCDYGKYRFYQPIIGSQVVEILYKYAKRQKTRTNQISKQNSNSQCESFNQEIQAYQERA